MNSKNSDNLILKFIYRLSGKICHLSYAFASKFFKSKGVIYMLHDISDNASEFSITEEQLESFLISVKEQNVINLLDWENETNFVAISIDDVPESFYTKGFSLFKRHNLPFTIFVSTELLDKPGYITSSQLREMSECKFCTVGSHGTIHDIYRKLKYSEKLDFLKSSKEQLSDICHKPIELFAFPYGSYYACGYTDKKLVADFYKYGFGTVNCMITSLDNKRKYFLPRKNLIL